MSRTVPVPRSRGGRVVLVAVLAAAVVAAIVLVVSWQRSVGHRAGEYADSFRDMPGVASVDVAGEGDGARDLAIHLEPTARRIQLEDVYDRVPNLPSSVVDDITITLGVVSAEAGDYDDGSADLQWALRGVRGDSVDLSVSRGEVEARTEQSSAVSVAREIVAALDLRSFSDVDLRVRGARGTTVSVSHDVSLAAARSVLGDIAPVASYLQEATVYDDGVTLALADGHTDRMAKVATAAQSAARHLRSFEGGADDVSFTVRDTGDGPSVTGDPDTDLGAARKVSEALRHKGWTVRFVQTDLSAVSVSDENASASFLPRLRKDLAALRPQLPKDSFITLQDPDRDRVQVFAGTMAELRRVTPTLVGLEHDGNQVYWETNSSGSTDISVLLPDDTPLSPESIKTVAGRLRALGWSGSADIVIQQRKDDEDDYFPPYIAFSSTAEGRASGMRLEPDDATVVTADGATRAWNSSATG